MARISLSHFQGLAEIRQCLHDKTIALTAILVHAVKLPRLLENYQRKMGSGQWQHQLPQVKREFVSVAQSGSYPPSLFLLLENSINKQETLYPKIVSLHGVATWTTPKIPFIDWLLPFLTSEFCFYWSESQVHHYLTRSMKCPSVASPLRVNISIHSVNCRNI